ncbi:MAG: hypothetical protein GWO16_03340 [Gammaproteobacteria bacterium]|nr:hypothetical protein [Gammaproteobacteria bacterium]NIR97139.1 hypothetical protein [Gammaproteobacteria bacterium]NIT62837.1 hypothetical protein [Gammaproteobacteria bacterium]NIV19801.1 hypothetical protein [Gammaproteobacteria bacterium]NIX11334.1 hypothetical protein [Gammaproteobacteria bacterium]
MPIQHSTKDRQMRQRIAMEAARILVDSGLPDYQAAKRKAAARLGAPDTRNLPSNLEIEEALAEHQRLFHAETQPVRLRELREAALRAMELLQQFDPRLVGPVLTGTAGEHSEVQLHLFAGAPEDVAFFLMDWNIPYEEGERRLRYARNGYQTYPAYRFLAGGVPIELTVFPVDGLRQAPRSPVDGKPMQRGGRAAVEALLAQG